MKKRILIAVVVLLLATAGTAGAMIYRGGGVQGFISLLSSDSNSVLTDDSGHPLIPN